jgi:glutathione S-transferase
MLTLYHHPICPHSRFVRLVLFEYGLPTRQLVERTWERREEFLILNPAGTLPVLITEDKFAVPTASVIIEYLDEIYGQELGTDRLLPQNRADRIEARRLTHWFNYHFFEEVSGPLTTEHYKQYLPIETSDGQRDSAAIRIALQYLQYYLDHLTFLLNEREWLAGPRPTYADFAAAAHLSIIPYFGRFSWIDGNAAKAWYERMQSRPAFQSMLGEAWKPVVR